MNILLTGGTGFIGSHTAVLLLQAGHQVVLYDNLYNSEPRVVDAIEKITGVKPHFVESDIRDTAKLRATLTQFSIEAVMNFAGLKAVGESVQEPLKYFDNNVRGSISLLNAMQATGVFQLVFSSSATVYGLPHYLPLDENHSTSALNPYGRTKLHIEEMLYDLTQSGPWKIANLRYFNPVGAHPSGLIGENPSGIPNNLMPYITRVAAGLLPELSIFGNDYDTPDGTGVRDYIHVMDLAYGHKRALEFLQYQKDATMETFNLGTGKGSSVLDLVAAFKASTGVDIAYRFVERRSGDAPACYASVQKAKEILGWQTKENLESMCASSWNFQQYKIKNS